MKRWSLAVICIANFAALFCTHGDAAVPSGAARGGAAPDLVFYMQGHYSAVHASPSAQVVGYMSNETVVGVLAAFNEVNAAGGLAGGRNLTLKLFDDKGSPEIWGPRGNTTAAMSDASVLGAVASKVSESFYVNPTARQLQMPVFGSTTVDQAELSQSTSNADFLIHTQLPLRSGGVAAVNFATKGHMHCRTFAVVYADAFGVGAVALDVVREIERIGLAASVVVGANLSLHAQPDQLARVVLARYAEAAVIPTCGVFLIDASALFAIIDAMSAALPAETFDDFSFFATAVASLPEWIDPSTGTSALFKNLYFSSSFPSAYDRRFSSIRHFQAAVEQLKQRQVSPVNSAFQPNVFAVNGYVSGRLLIETVNRIGLGKTITRQSLKDAVYRTKMFAIDDLILGPYSNGCSGRQTAATGACWCTAGMKRMFFSQVDSATGAVIPVFDPPYFPGIAEVPVPLTSCDIDAETTLRRPFIVIAARESGGLHPTTFAGEAVMGLPLSSTSGVSTFFDSSSAAQVLDRAVENLRSFVRTALARNTLAHGPLLALPVDESSITNVTLKKWDVRYRLVFLMGAVYDPAKVYPVGIENKSLEREREVAEEETDSSTTLPPTSDTSAVHVLDIAPATSAFRDHDDPWRPPEAHLPLRIPFFPTLADFAVTAAAFCVRRLGRRTAASRRVAIVADSDFLKTIGTKSIETYLRTSPAASFVADAGLTAPELDILLRSAGQAVTAPTSVPPVRWTGAVIIITRRRAVMEAAVRAAETFASSIAYIIAADEFVLENVTRAMSVSAVSVPLNVFFASGLPQYRKIAGPGDRRVSATESYSRAIAATVKALYDLSAGSADGSALEIATEAYRNLAVPVAAAGISLAPLWADRCLGLSALTWPHPGGECQCAKGLNTFFVRRLRISVVNSTNRGHFSHRHSGCGPAFVPLAPAAESDPLLTPTIASFIAVGASVVIFATAALGITARVLCAKGSTRDDSNAPKNAESPFTIVFTDIQASTRLWAHAPDRMGEALDVHHRLMREAIKRRRGYEVKTIGDSFMVAFQDPHDALRFAFDVQLMLHSEDMGTDVFDQVYREATAQGAEYDAAFHMIDQHESTDGYSPSGEYSKSQITTTVFEFHTDNHHSEPSQGAKSVDELKRKYDPRADDDVTAPPDDYRLLWSGLRVRIGIHHGIGNIKFDETSNGYDYYGTVVNTAARVEGVGHGGQILMTEAAYECVGDTAISQLQGAVVDLGPQPLRGLPEPVRLFQVLPEVFCARRFPGLRLDVENEVDAEEPSVGGTGDEDTGNDRETHGGSDRTGPGGDVFGELTKKLRLRSPTVSRLLTAAAFDTVSTLLAAMKPAGRRDTLKALSAAWRAHGVWSGPHMRRIERTSALSTDQLTLLATVGRAVQALEIQTRHSNSSSPPTVNGNFLETSFSTNTSRAGSKAQPQSFTPGLGFAAVQQALETAVARAALSATATQREVSDVSECDASVTH